jgi:hypothetical protein
VYVFINLVCDKRERFGNKVWERLISENSVYRDELYKLFTLEYVKVLSGQIDDLSHTKKTRSRQTPALPLRDLQRLLLIFWGLFPSHPQKINYSIRCEISKPQQDVRAAAGARRRCEGVWNHHPWWVQVFSVYDFINLVCQKNDAYSWQVWKRISENSKFKDGIEFKMEILTDQSGELSFKGETRTRQTQTWPSCQCKNQLALRIVTRHKQSIRGCGPSCCVSLSLIVFQTCW